MITQRDALPGSPARRLNELEAENRWQRRQLHLIMFALADLGAADWVHINTALARDRVPHMPAPDCGCITQAQRDAGMYP
jgi:hypothetical protein